MNIKAKLKSYDTTLAELAKLLYISRPTLNTYISMFENNQKLSNEKYQIIFETLFSGELSKEDFDKYVCRFNNMITRDELLGTSSLNPVKTDTIYYLIDEMKKDLYTDDSNEKVYIFIRMLLNSYRSVPVFEDLIDYFLTLNNLSELSSYDLNKQQKLSMYYEFFSKIRDNKITYEQRNLDLFNERIEQLKEQNQKAMDALKNKINEKVNSEIARQVKTGKDINFLTETDIIKNFEE